MDKASKPSRWQKFLKNAIPGKKAREHFQRFMGYLLLSVSKTDPSS